MPQPNVRLYGATRTVLITFGVAAFAFLFSRPGPGSGAGFVLVGIALQIVLMAVHAIIKRRAPDPAAAMQGRLVIELIGDGITVLLFAIGVFGPILRAADV